MLLEHYRYMARTSRIVAPGYFHHITHRGNNRENVFLCDADRVDYLRRLSAGAKSNKVRVIGYCLMTNHVHLIACPETDGGLASWLRKTHGEYAQSFNRRTQRCGHLWQERFFSCVLEDSHVLNALRYVDLNPVRAKMVRSAAEWPWSSAAAHLGKSDRPDLLSDEWKTWRDLPDWTEFLCVGDDESGAELLRSCTRRNRPLGSGAFLARLNGRRVENSRGAIASA